MLSLVVYSLQKGSNLNDFLNRVFALIYVAYIKLKPSQLKRKINCSETHEQKGEKKPHILRKIFDK